MLDAGDLGPGMGRGAGRDQDMGGADARAARKPHRVGILEHRAALDDLDARPAEGRRIGRLEAGDLLVLVGDQGRPVEGRRVQRPAVAGRLFEIERRSGTRRREASSARSRGSRRCRRPGIPRPPSLSRRSRPRCAPRARRRTRRRSRTGRRREPPSGRRALTDRRQRQLHRSWPFFFISARNLFRISSAICLRPGVRMLQSLVDERRLLGHELLADGRFVEGDDLLHFRLR